MLTFASSSAQSALRADIFALIASASSIETRIPPPLVCGWVSSIVSLICDRTAGCESTTTAGRFPSSSDTASVSESLTRSVRHLFLSRAGLNLNTAMADPARALSQSPRFSCREKVVFFCCSVRDVNSEIHTEADHSGQHQNRGGKLAPSPHGGRY